MQHLKEAPLSGSLRLINKRVLIIFQMSGAAPFPCPGRWREGGGGG